MNDAVINFRPYIHTSFVSELTKIHKTCTISKSCMISCDGTRAWIHPLGNCTLTAQSTGLVPANGSSMLCIYTQVTPTVEPNAGCTSTCNATVSSHCSKNQEETRYVSDMWRK